MPAPAATLRQPDPERLQFLPLGIGNAFTRLHFNSSFLIFAAGTTILVDAPAPLRRVLGDAERRSAIPLDLDRIDHVFLTHLHGDHCNGLEELGFWRHFLGGDAPPPVLHVHHEMRDALWHQRLRASMGNLGPHLEVGLEHYFDVRDYRAGDHLDFGIEGFCLEPRMTTHMVPCAGFRVSWRGRTLGYSADTGFDPTLIDFFAGCDCFIHETSHGFGHTPLADLVALPEPAKRRLYITHIPDDLDPATSPLPVLEEGRLYDVEAPR